MSATLAELDEMVKQAGFDPYTWEMRGDEVWVRHIVSGGVDDPVYTWSRVGTIDEVERITRAFLDKWKPRTVSG